MNTFTPEELGQAMKDARDVAQSHLLVTCLQAGTTSAPQGDARVEHSRAVALRQFELLHKLDLALAAWDHQTPDAMLRVYEAMNDPEHVEIRLGQMETVH